MQSHEDRIGDLDAKRDERVAFRVPAHIKEKLVQASEILGIDMSTLIANAALREAEDVLYRQQVTILEPKDHDVFLSALGGTSRSVPDLFRDAMVHNKKHVISGDD